MNTSSASTSPPASAQDSAPPHAYTLRVPIAFGALHFIPDPVAEPHLEWSLRYASEVSPQCRLAAASVVSSLDYLLSESVTTAEAIRRLRLIRAARRGRLSERAGR